MADLNLSAASQSAIANTEDEGEQKPLLDPRVDELMQKVEILSQKVQLNEKEKIADVKEQAPLLDKRVDDLISKVEDLTRKRDDNVKDKCGDVEDQKSIADPRLNDALKKIEDLNRELKEKEDLFLKKVEHQNQTIFDLQEQFSLMRNSPNKSPDGVNFGRADENLDALQLQRSDQTQDVQDWNENEIHLVYDIAEAFTCFLRLLAAVIFLSMINDLLFDSGNVTYVILIFALSIVFEMMTSTFERQIMKMAYFASWIGLTLLLLNNGQPIFQFQNIVGATASYQAMVAIAALLIVFGQAVTVIGVIKYQKSRPLKAAYVANVVVFILWIYMRCVVVPDVWTLIPMFPCFFLHAVLLVFGLPASKSYRDTPNQNHHTNTHPSNNPDNSASNDSMQPNALLPSSNVHHQDQSGLDSPETPNSNKIINDNNYQLQQKTISLQNTLAISATDQNIPSSYKAHRRNRLSILYGVDKDANIKGELKRDIYTMMMLSHWKHRSFLIPKWCCCSWCRNKYYVVFVPLPSKSWIMGLAVFSVQFALGALIIADQLKDDTDTYMNIPPRNDPVVLVGQFMTVVLALFSQTDITITLYNLFQLWYGSKSQWNKVIGEEHDTSFKLWLGRIFAPNVLKISQGVTILIASIITILQSDEIVELLKDFTALFVISSVDDMLFILSDYGYFGVDLSKKSDRLKAIEIIEDDEKIRKTLQFILFTMIGGLLGWWIFVVKGQINGRYFLQIYPDCPINDSIDVDMNTDFTRTNKQRKYSFYMKDDVCDFPTGVGPNVAVCGWEGGDCKDLNRNFMKYPSCPVSNNVYHSFTGDWKKKYSSFIDNAICDFALGVGPNIEECGWEGGDCLLFNQQYPNCTESKIYLVQSGQCDSETNIEECGFDGNDCLEENEQLQNDYPNCSVRSPSWIGDGICDGFDYNTTECGWDGGDCLELQQEFPNCKGKKRNIGNGICGGRTYNTKECGWDGGDCFDFNQKYPFCKTDFPWIVGDGRCHKENNVMECGWDGGDCVEWNEKYPNCDFTWIFGDGWCHPEWNNPECGFDDGHCNEDGSKVREKYPKCSVSIPWNIGNGICNLGEFNVEECGFDGGDCLDFNKKYPDCRAIVSDRFARVGDGICHRRESNVEECGYEDGDCLEFNQKYPDCKAFRPEWIGDGRCNGDKYNEEECGFDGGDCLN